jgi:hypothetical protein
VNLRAITFADKGLTISFVALSAIAISRLTPEWEKVNIKDLARAGPLAQLVRAADS